MPENPLTLSLDIGTSSTRALLWDSQGREVDGVKAQTQYKMHTSPDGGVEMPADEFIGYVGDCIEQALQQAGDRAGLIRAVGISTYWHSLIGLDADARPITPIYSWADTRAGEAARKLRSEWNESAIHARTGCMLHPSYYPAKLTWLQDTQPDIYEKAARWASPSEYLFGILFGSRERCVSVSMASGTGLFHQEQCTWDDEILRRLNLDAAKLAPIVDLKHPSQGLTAAWASRWPALKSVPFFSAVGDGACGNIGSGCLTPNRMAINLGTSGAIRVVWDEGQATERVDTGAHHVRPQPQAPLQSDVKSPKLAPPRGLWRYRVDSRRPIIGGAFSDGGNVFAWMNENLRLPSGADLEKAIAEIEPGAHGLIFLPFLAGERSIGWNPDARATLSGMNLNTRPIDILHASLEAVALRFALAADLLKEVFPAAEEIVASGGALSHSPAWAQMFADALGKPVILAAEAEASSRGAALLAMEAAGIVTDIGALDTKMGATYMPDTKRRLEYVHLLGMQQALYTKLMG